jgi:hypothetical protein
LALIATGEIVPGDYARLAALLGRNSSHRIIMIVLDSPGGTLSEAARLTEVIRDRRWASLVVGGAECASACFLLYVAAPMRFIYPGALIGVHSVSDGGTETFASQAFTTQMARLAASPSKVSIVTE